MRRAVVGRKRDDSRSPGRDARNRKASRPRGENAVSHYPGRVVRAAAIRADLQRIIGADAIESVRIEQLQTNPSNARRHSDQQIDQIAASIHQFGFLNPIIIDENNQVLGGHARLAAATRAKLKCVPCVRVDHLTPEAKRAFALADNRLAELSEWDADILAAELSELASLDLDFDIEITGFDTVDLDRLLGPEPDPHERDGISTDPDDELPPLLDEPVSRLGDLWVLSRHRVICGDALKPETYAQVLQGEKATQVFADSPYNVRIRGHVSSKTGFREFPMAAGEMSSAEFVEFLWKFLQRSAACAVDGAIIHACIDWRHLEDLLRAARAAGLALLNVCTWAKPQGGMGSFYRSQTEFIVVLKVGSAPHLNTFGLGERGRTRTNLWRYPSVRGPRRGVNAPESGGHPTVKPASLVIDALRDCSHRGDVVLDPFGGSGTTLIAAERIGRCARLIELDPAYVDLIVRRWQALFELPARLATDGRTFQEVSADRTAGETKTGEPTDDGDIDAEEE